jgi:hypothetical protein
MTFWNIGLFLVIKRWWAMGGTRSHLARPRRYCAVFHDAVFSST